MLDTLDLEALRASARTPWEQRLWARATVVGDCWEFTGARVPAGYGKLLADGRVQYTHRLSFLATTGPIPVGAVVMHACDNPPCINPAHLSVGSQADNVRDRDAKGRRTQFLGGWAQRNREKTHCLRGHEMAGDNVIRRSDGRECRACRSCRARRYASRLIENEASQADIARAEAKAADR